MLQGDFEACRMLFKLEWGSDVVAHGCSLLWGLTIFSIVGNKMNQTCFKTGIEPHYKRHGDPRLVNQPWAPLKKGHKNSDSHICVSSMYNYVTF